MNLRALAATVRLHLLPTNLARRWVDEKLVDEADQLRRELIRAEALIDRQTQAMRRGEETLNDAAAELAQMARANLLLSARVGELEQAIVSMGAEAIKGTARAGLDAAWDDVAALGNEARPR